MKNYSTSAKHSLLTVSIILAGLSSIDAKCPPIGRDDVRDICRWKGFRIFGVQAGKKEIGKVMLKNIGECGEEKSITEYFTKNPKTSFYSGKVAKDLKDPSKIYCIYNIDKHLIKFLATGVGLEEGSELPEEPAAPLPPPRSKPRTIRGIDITAGPEERDVPLAKPGASQVPPPPPRMGRPVPPPPAYEESSESESPPPAYEPPQPSSSAPQYPPPAPPKAKPLDMKSELEERLKKRKAVEYGSSPVEGIENVPPPPPRHRPAEPVYGAND
jgi:hypothetical protein